MSSSGSRVKAPPVSAPAPVYGQSDPTVVRAGEDRRRRMLAAAGRSGTILTGLGGQQMLLGNVA